MNNYLETAVTAARAAGDLIRAHFGQSLTVQAEEAHDIKLELDVRAQELISGLLLKEFPSHRIIGEEGPAAETQVSSDQLVWVIDPIDGTVNFFYNVPHFCISIALQRGDRTLVGVVFDPIKDELWTVAEDQPPQLNERPFRVSNRSALSEAIVSVGFSKTARAIELGLRTFNSMICKARKCRMMGSAALDLAYVACGRFDAYIEKSVNLWDVAAGAFLVEAAGGTVEIAPSPLETGKLAIVATNGKIHLELKEEMI